MEINPISCALIFSSVCIYSYFIYIPPLSHAEPQLPCMTTMPMVVVSNDTFNVSCICGTNDVQTLHNPEYQFFFNGKPINVSTLNSSYTMVQASKTGNFTCRAIQYTDKRTPIPTQLSPPVQAIVLGEFLSTLCSTSHVSMY